MDKSNKLLRIYDGFSGENNLRINVFQKSITFSRNYVGRSRRKGAQDPKICLTWKFDKKGKTNCISRYSFQKSMDEIFFEVMDS